jgi:transketolase
VTVKPIAMRDAFLRRVLGSMDERDNIFLVTADFGSPVMDQIRAEFPDRFINVGVAEQNLINVSTGLALEGFTVFAYAIAPFITMRCFEQIRVNLALLSQVRDINVNLIGVGAGYSYVVSGPTHQCYEDITIMRALPTVEVLSPSDHLTAEAMFASCIDNAGPKYLRLDAQVLPAISDVAPTDIVRGFRIVRPGKDVCLIATGFMVHTAITVANMLTEDGFHLGVIDLFALTRLSRDDLLKHLSEYRFVVTLEESFVDRGGLDSLVRTLLAPSEGSPRILSIGVPDRYEFALGSREELHERVGIGKNAVVRRIQSFLSGKN